MLENPLVVIGILAALAFVTYFSFEYKYIILKPKQLRASIMVWWGLLFGGLALILLYSPIFGASAGAFDLMPAELAYGRPSLGALSVKCTTTILADDLAAVRGACDLVNIIVYVSYGTLAFSLFLILTGVLLYLKVRRMATSHGSKKCVLCGLQIPGDEQFCPECGTDQEHGMEKKRRGRRSHAAKDKVEISDKEKNNP